MADFKYRDEAIPLITVREGERGKLKHYQAFQVNPEAIEFFRSIPQPIAIVGVAGMYRTGKSYLLNRVILNRGTGFGVGPTINPCTKGIWVWGRPLRGQTNEGDPVNLIVIDSEGIGALDESPEHDARIFSLTILLSSAFIYNSVGTIDENALQNLNLIVNITKNIHLKSKGNDEVDLDEYSQYFPAFLWVVRDFSLQLVDQDGEQITPKEYLENALMPQKGFSETVESKNRIRRMIQSFFKERDCTTMIRPLLDDKNLGKLQDMELDQMRPEFQDQVRNLRNRIIYKAKIKTLNNKPLTGLMLASLLQSYVTSINEGAVPNIESAWTYICKSQCNNALQNAFNEYEEMFKDALAQSWPMAPEYLVSIHKDCREQAIRSYKQNAVGDARDQYMEELETRMYDKLQWLENENKRDFENNLQQTLGAIYAKLERKLQNNDYKDFFEYEKEVRQLQITLNDMDLSGPNKEGLIAEFMLKKIPEAVYSFMSNLKKDNESAISELERSRQRLEKEVASTKEESLKEKSRLNSVISDLESVKSELKVKLQCVTDNLEIVKADKQELEKRLGDELAGERAKAKQAIHDLTVQIESYRESAQTNERNLIIMSSKFDQEKALMAQRLSFYEMTDKTINEKEKIIQEELSRVKDEHNLQIKALNQKNREVVERLEHDTKLLNQKLSDTLEDIKELQTERSTLQNTLKDKEAQHKTKVTQLMARLEDLETDRQANSKILRADIDATTEQELRRQNESALSKINTLENEYRIKEEDYKALKSRTDKEKAINTQAIDFLQKQLKELRIQIEENKKIHETALKALESNPNSSRVDINVQLEVIRDSHKKELKQLEGELSNTRKRLQEELSDISNQKEQLEKTLNSTRTELLSEISSMSEKITTLSIERERWLGDAKTSEEAKFRLVKEIEERFKSKLVSLERENEELKDMNMREISDVQQKSEEDFKRMKMFFEEERVRLETKIVEDKERYEKKLATTVEDYEQKISRDQSYHEEEIDNFQQEIGELQISNNAIVQHMEQELNSKTTNLDQLEKQLKEAKENLRNIQQTANANMEQALKEHTEERKVLNGKLEQVKNELTMKEKDVYASRQAAESYKAELDKLRERSDEKVIQLTEENHKLSEKYSELNSLYQKINDEYMDFKIESGKSVALSQQQNEFYSKRIDELLRQLDDSNRRVEDKLRAQRESHQSEVDKLIQQARDDKLALEDKYETKRKALKEADSKYQKRITDIEKDKTLLTEKLTTAEAELSKLDKKQANEIESLNAQILSLKEAINQEKKSASVELERLKKRVYDLEIENAEVNSNYDKDKALWEGKFSFLEAQRDQFKEDAIEYQHNFDTMLHKFQSFRNADKEETATSQSALVATIEQRYNSQMAEVNESHRMQVSELQEKIQKMERENRNLIERMNSEGSGKSLAAIKALETKIADMTSREQTFNDQILFLKNDRDQKLIDHQQLMEKERDSFKKRLNEIEARYKEADNKRSQLMYEHEKEKTKWNIEKDHLSTHRNEYLEQIDKLQKKNETLTRENEKYRTELRKNKKVIGSSNMPGFMSGNGYVSGLNNSKFGERSFNRDQYV